MGVGVSGGAWSGGAGVLTWAVGGVSRVQVQAVGGLATLPTKAYGAFTVGVECDDGKTRLELDLADCLQLPRDFRER